MNATQSTHHFLLLGGHLLDPCVRFERFEDALFETVRHIRVGLDFLIFDISPPSLNFGVITRVFQLNGSLVEIVEVLILLETRDDVKNLLLDSFAAFVELNCTCSGTASN